MKVLLTLLGILVIIGLVFAHSNYTGYSGAPGSSGTCAASCHGSGGGTIQLSNFPAQYSPGQTYTLTISHSGGSSIRQFNGSCRIGTGSQTAGVISSGSNTVTYSTGSEPNGIHFTSTNQNSGTFYWTAPAAGTGDVRLYIAGLQGSYSGANSTLSFLSTEQSGAPQISVSPDSLIFPPTYVGDTGIIPLIISNTGDANLIIYDMENSIEDIFSFNWNPDDSLIRPGDELVVDVTFEPSDTILYADELIIYSNDDQTSVYLEGRGDPQLHAGKEEEKLPLEFGLMNAYPNPFNPSTTIEYQLPKVSNIELTVYDVMGREVTKLVNDYKSHGTYSITFNASDQVSGIYFVRLKAGDFTATQKLLLIK